MDLASSESEESGLACPPAKFVTPEALKLARNCLRPNGNVYLTRVVIGNLFRCVYNESCDPR